MKKKYDRMNIPPELKLEILRVIRKPMPTNMEEADTVWWCSRLAEAKRYLMLKIRIANDIIRSAQLEMQILEDSIYESCRMGGVGSISERKRIAEAQLGTDPKYKELSTKINKATGVVEDLNADLENVNDKTFAIRKVMDYIKVHLMYEE